MKEDTYNIEDLKLQKGIMCSAIWNITQEMQYSFQMSVV